MTNSLKIMMIQSKTSTFLEKLSYNGHEYRLDRILILSGRDQIAKAYFLAATRL
jgi:hypothetical protein